jgi:hypothetical protein
MPLRVLVVEPRKTVIVDIRSPGQHDGDAPQGGPACGYLAWSDAEWQPAQSGLMTGDGRSLLCDGRRAGPAILMLLALTSRRVPRLRRSRETHAEEAHSGRSAA